MNYGEYALVGVKLVVVGLVVTFAVLVSLYTLYSIIYPLRVRWGNAEKSREVERGGVYGTYTIDETYPHYFLGMVLWVSGGVIGFLTIVGYVATELGLAP